MASISIQEDLGRNNERKIESGRSSDHHRLVVVGTIVHGPPWIAHGDPSSPELPFFFTAVRLSGVFYIICSNFKMEALFSQPSRIHPPSHSPYRVYFRLD